MTLTLRINASMTYIGSVSGEGCTISPPPDAGAEASSTDAPSDGSGSGSSSGSSSGSDSGSSSGSSSGGIDSGTPDAPFDSPSCGLFNEACCSGSVCLSQALTCNLGTCVSSPGDSGPGPDTGAACNVLTNVAPAITGAAVATVAPTSPTDGSIVAGPYYLTSYISYTGPGGFMGSFGTTQITVEVRPGTGNGTVDTIESAGAGNHAFTFGYTTPDAGALAWSQLCDDTCHCPILGTVNGYTATSTELDLYATLPTSTTIFKFARH